MVRGHRRRRPPAAQQRRLPGDEQRRSRPRTASARPSARWPASRAAASRSAWARSRLAATIPPPHSRASSAARGRCPRKAVARSTLGGVNTFAGGTLINRGTLKLAAGASLAASDTIRIASGALLDVSANAGFTIAAGKRLSGSGSCHRPGHDCHQRRSFAGQWRRHADVAQRPDLAQQRRHGSRSRHAC